MKILIPTDFSDVSANALKFVLQITKKLDAEITVLHARSMRGQHEAMMVNIEEQVRKNSEEDLEKFVAKCLKGKSVANTINTVFIPGLAKEVICKYSENNNFDLIVVGTEVKSALQKILLGTTSSYVLDNASVPVIIIPEDYSIDKADHAMFATDLEYLTEEFEVFYKIAKYFISDIEILHITEDDPKEVELKASPLIKELKSKHSLKDLTFTVRKNDDVAEGIEAHVQAVATDFVIVFIKKRGFIDRLFDSSLTQQLADRMMIPIFAFKKTSVTKES